MSNLDEILHSPQAAKIMDNSKQLGHLKSAPETQKIFAMLEQNTGGNLEKAAGSAANGDSAQLMDAIKKLMQNPEAKQLINQIKSKLK